MMQISQNNLYAPTYSQYEDFCNKSIYSNDKNCFCSIFIFTICDIVVGFLNARIAFTEADIDFICVDPQYRRKHIAEKIFNFFNTVINKENFSTLFLEVGIHNTPAISFYNKLGFKKVSIRKKYYKNGEDALVLSKHLRN